MAKTNHGLKLLTMIFSVFLIGYFLEAFKVGPGLLRDYFLISIELLPLVLSFSIFVMTGFVYHRSKDNHSLFRVVRDNGIGIPTDLDFRKANSWGN